ncbi:hypothetical protein LUA82_04195 [Neoehrlichia mikurensis]|nr:hypothetical protein [Neoehrlichia mikurensis]UTO55353.1 hypothetical protein LUA82_04195 [Neoehrlichia mikurensis]
MIEGIAKHNGPLIVKNDTNQDKEIHEFIIECDNIYDLELEKFPTLEAQVASISDDIAYTIHDIDDGFRESILIIEELLELPLIGKIIKNTIDANKGLSNKYIINESLRQFYNIVIDNVVLQVEHNLKEYNIVNQYDVKDANILLVNFSLEYISYIKGIKLFLHRKLYQHDKVRRITNKLKYIIKNLFKAYYKEIKYLPLDWQGKLNSNIRKSIVICDFISGMTDRFAIQEHKRIYGNTVI